MSDNKPSKTKTNLTDQSSNTNSGLLRPSSMDRNRPVSTAERVFSGSNSTNRGFMCNNLMGNPFTSVHSTSSANGGNILQKSKLVLKPSAFGSKPSETSSSMSGDDTTKNPLLSKNPFLKPPKLLHEPDEIESSTLLSDPKIDNKSHSSDGKDSSSDEAEDSTNEEIQESKESEENIRLKDSKSVSVVGNSASNTFTISTTLGQSMVPGESTASSVASTFVFGEHLDERVTNVATENGSSSCEKLECETLTEKPKTLEEAADEYKRQQESGPLLPEVQTFTGEEDESNVLQITCKLFLFQRKESSWVEKGRGLLRLNDRSDGSGNSRLVMRTVGTLTLLLNTKLWPRMICNRASHKSVQITATDEGEVHVYLISGSQSDMDQVYNSINYRLTELKQKESRINKSDPKNKEESAPEPQEQDAGLKMKVPENEPLTTSDTLTKETSQKRAAEKNEESSPKKRKPIEEDMSSPST